MAEQPTNDNDQEFCLRWNNFQANFTSQFEALRDDEDFTDVTIACDGQRMQAHKVVLSACSPFFKELFKTNPCSHPIIFMRDVEAKHIGSLMEFMYTGEVNVAQAHLPAFLKTAESLKIRGLTDSGANKRQKDVVEEGLVDPEITKTLTSESNLVKRALTIVANTSTANQKSKDTTTAEELGTSSPPAKRQCKSEAELLNMIDNIEQVEEKIDIIETPLPKEELSDYLSDEDRIIHAMFPSGDLGEVPDGVEVPPKVANIPSHKDNVPHHQPQHCATASDSSKRRRSSSSSSSEQCQTGEANKPKHTRLFKLGEGVVITEDQLRSVKWNDYRKLTRGLATILFSPSELASSSVTGQRWSRAGSGERPVKPALDKTKVQAIISCVAARFPAVKISRVKQVLAYKCKELSTASKMKAVRYYE